MWNRIRKIKGKESSNSVYHLFVNDRDITSHRDIPNALADNVSHNSSSAFSTDAFTSVRCKVEKQNINFSSLEELQNALRRAHDIHHQLLKHLSDAYILLLLNILFTKSGSLVTFLLIG